MTHRLYRTLAWMLTLASLLTFLSPARAQAPATDQNMKYQVVSQRDDRLIVRLPNRMLLSAQRISTAPVEAQASVAEANASIADARSALATAQRVTSQESRASASARLTNSASAASSPATGSPETHAAT